MLWRGHWRPCVAREANLSDLSAIDPVSLALQVAAAFDVVGIEYFLGGSMASSYQGEPRATNDIDFVVAMATSQAAVLEAALGDDFLVDAESLEQAVRDGQSWNLIHYPTVTKVDLIMRGQQPFDDSEFDRRAKVEVGQGRFLYMKSAEDSVLRKLLWFRAGGEVSDRQWRDVLGILRHARPKLDDDYLDRWADRLLIRPLLDAARSAI